MYEFIMDKLKFNGKKLRKARVYNAMTLKELATRSDLTKQSISFYEVGSVIPKYETVMRFAKVLKFPFSYFYSKSLVQDSLESTYFRSLSKTTQKCRLAQRERADLLLNIFSALDHYINFPDTLLPPNSKVKLPEVEDDVEKAKQVDNSIESITMELRAFWNIPSGPIHNLQYWLEKNGIIVTQIADNEQGIDAFSQQKLIFGKPRFLIVLVTGNKPIGRIRFDMAHELGHIILHTWNESVTELPRAEFKEREIQANKFAGALLMPASDLKNDFPKEREITLDDFIPLKQKWNVSIQAILYRGAQLGLISQEKYQHLFKSLSKKGWRKKEPFDRPYVLKDTLITRAFKLLMQNGYNAEDIMKALKDHGVDLYPEMIESLCYLPSQILSVKKNDPQIIKMR